MTAPRISYRFTIGAFECLAITDGTHVYHTDVLFADIPRERLEPVLHQYHVDPTTITTPYTCLLINTGPHQVLIDTGAGVEDEPDATSGHLLEHLRAQAIAPEAIDTVILTHAHPDHIGGVIDGQGRAVFPSARYVMAQDEWAFWMGDAPDLTGVTLAEGTQRFFAQFARDHLLPLQDRIALVNPGTEIVAGVHVVAAPGHTAGHLAVSVASRGDQFLVLGDAALHPIQLEHPEWTAPVDLRPDQTVATRRQLFNRAAAQHELIHLFHFPFPGLGRIAHRYRSRFPFLRAGHASQDSGTWQWQPVEPMA
jgi:glyoxylase-like metal-dependent hydrolase (beta-lactamase superfamily II)